MSQGARLTTVDAVPLLKAALQTFAEEAAAALADFDMELGRVVEWIGHDRPDYWKRQIRSTDERVAELRVALERAMLFKSIDGHQPPCHDERKALLLAKQRMQRAEETLELVRRWSRTLERDITEFRAVVNQLASWLQVDFPKSVNALERMRSALETYLAIESPAEAPRLPPVMLPETAPPPADTPSDVPPPASTDSQELKP